MESAGYIYILTNPSFKEYVKIGYADNVKNRVKQLNNSEALPFAFRIYATYKVNQRLQDKKIHEIIDKLNPSLRSIEDVDGKLRKREFYAMNAETAYSVFEAMADIHNCHENLVKFAPTVEERKDEEIANKISRVYKNFYSMGLVDGDEIYWKRRPEYKATICGANELKYKGEVYSPSKLLWEIWKKETNDTTVVGTPYDEFKFNDDHNCLSHRWFSMNKQDND